MARRSRGRPGKFETPQEVLELHDFARGQYVEALQESEHVHKLVFGEWETRQDVADSPPPHRPGKPRAILDNFRRHLSAGIGSDMEIRVLPLREGEAEDEKCSRLEQALEGLDWELAWESGRDYKRDAVFWYVFRGRACIEQRFRRELIGTAHTPYELMADDPNGIFPVRGRRGILWYTKEYCMYAGELRRDMEAKGRRLEFLADCEDNDEIEVVEYWDDRYHAAVTRQPAEFIVNVAPEYGFVPLAEARCMDTPLASAKYAFASVIAPVMDELKLQAELAEKMRTAVTFYFYPYLFGVSADGKPFVINVAEPGLAPMMPPGSKLEQVLVNVNHAIFQQLFQYTQSNVNLATMPESTFGVEPQSIESGFAISQVLNQSRMAVLDKLPDLERAFGQAYSNVLRLVETFGRLDGGALRVHADYDR